MDGLHWGGSPQRDGHGWSTLRGQSSERWSWMVYTVGAVLREMVMDGLHLGVEGGNSLSLPWERWFKKVNDPEEVRGNSPARHGFSGPLFPCKGSCLHFLGF